MKLFQEKSILYVFCFIALEVMKFAFLFVGVVGFSGSKSLGNVVNVSGIGLFDRPMFQAFEKEEKDGDGDDEDYEVCLNQTGKKRRLTNEQVKSLESNFEVENKLGPKRKVQLAKELGLEPRQVAIWFQNRRARFKTKQLEKDYTTLKGSYDVLKVDYDNLLQENDKLKQEVPILTCIKISSNILILNTIYSLHFSKSL